MMQTLIGTLFVFALVIGAMAVGVAATGRALRGSCGGTGEACRCSRSARRSCELAKIANESQ